MFQLDTNDYGLLKPLITAEHGIELPWLYAVLERRCLFDVFVDNLNQPRQALISNGSSEALLVRLIGNGTKNGEISSFYTEAADWLVKQHQEMGTQLFVSSTDGTWEPVFRERLKPYYKINRTQFAFHDAAFQAAAAENQTCEGDTQILRIDRNALQTHEVVRHFCCQTWADVDAFLNNGLGVYALCGNKVAGICASFFSGGGYDEINIATLPQFRGQGIALMLGKAFVNLCQDHGRTPCWSCDTDNVASHQLALKLGFQPDAPYMWHSTYNLAAEHETPRQP